MVSVGISDYMGLDILQKYERELGEIHKDGLANALAVKNLQAVLRTVTKKHLTLNDAYKQFFTHTENLHLIKQSILKLARNLGDLLGEFQDMEDMISVLESVCDEEDQVERILKAHDQNHALRMQRQQEIEELKASLAKEHATYLENLRTERAERKMNTEKAIHSAIWKTEDDATCDELC